MHSERPLFASSASCGLTAAEHAVLEVHIVTALTLAAASALARSSRAERRQPHKPRVAQHALHRSSALSLAVPQMTAVPFRSPPQHQPLQLLLEQTRTACKRTPWARKPIASALPPMVTSVFIHVPPRARVSPTPIKVVEKDDSSTEAFLFRPRTFDPNANALTAASTRCLRGRTALVHITLSNPLPITVVCTRISVIFARGAVVYPVATIIPAHALNHHVSLAVKPLATGSLVALGVVLDAFGVTRSDTSQTTSIFSVDS